MKFLKIFSIALIIFSLVGCGHPKEITVGGVTKEYPTYGLFNEKSEKSEHICYEISVGNVIWSILGIENIIMPVYFIGFSIYNPISAKNLKGECGIDKE